MAQVLLVGADLPTLLRASDSDLEAQFPWVPQRFLVRHTRACRNRTQARAHCLVA